MKELTMSNIDVNPYDLGIQTDLLDEVIEFAAQGLIRFDDSDHEYNGATNIYALNEMLKLMQAQLANGTEVTLRPRIPRPSEVE